MMQHAKTKNRLLEMLAPMKSEKLSTTYNNSIENIGAVISSLLLLLTNLYLTREIQIITYV